MKRSSPPVQPDLFSSTAAPPAVTSLQLHHDELVELLSQLLWEVVRSAAPKAVEEIDDEQDQR